MVIYGNERLKFVDMIKTKPLCAYSSNLADMLYTEKDFWRSNVKVTMGIIGKMWGAQAVFQKTLWLEDGCQ